MQVDLDGVIGAGLLSQFRCTFADGGRLLWVEDDAALQKVPGRATPAGAALALGPAAQLPPDHDRRASAPPSADRAQAVTRGGRAMSSLLAVYAGSFDPVTLGHLDLIERAPALFDEVDRRDRPAPDQKPLFTFDERIDLLREVTRDLRQRARRVVRRPAHPLLREASARASSCAASARRPTSSTSSRSRTRTPTWCPRDRHGLPADADELRLRLRVARARDREPRRRREPLRARPPSATRCGRSSPPPPPPGARRPERRAGRRSHAFAPIALTTPPASG